MARSPRDVVGFLNFIVNQGVDLSNSARQGDFLDASRSGAFFIGYQRWRRNVFEAFSFLGMTSYSEEATRLFGLGQGHAFEIANVTGLVASARDIVSEGFIGNIKILLHAEMFGSLLEQARALLETGHEIAAAVLGRIIIEDWLGDEAERMGIDIADHPKASVLNDRLRKDGIFSVPRWRQIQGLLDVGNAAAHGKVESFTGTDVARILEFVEENCLQRPTQAAPADQKASLPGR